MSAPVLEISNLSVAIKGVGDRPHAVRGINLSVGANEIVCVVGESGSGKSVTAQAVMGLLPKKAMEVDAGSIRLEGEELTTKSDADLRAIRGTRMAMVFQEPMTALNPVERVGDQIEDHRRGVRFDDDLEPVVPQHPRVLLPRRRAVGVELLAVHDVAPGDRRILQSRPERASVEDQRLTGVIGQLGEIDAGELTHRREQVDHMRKSCVNAAFDAGSGDDQRHVHALLEQRALGVVRAPRRQRGLLG